MKFAEDVLNEKDRPMISVQQDVTLMYALSTMVKNNIGAIVIKDGDRVVGIFTERDLLKQSVKKIVDPEKTMIKDLMTTSLFSAPYNDPIYMLLDKILGKRVRHIFIEKEGKYIGILSAGDVTKACLNERTREMESFSWDYYENWRWKPKKKS
ncbi:CBS domain-containing protein [bacterium]|nr:CBS domain-containing protein [bacterium]MBU1063790.1 CBS domain-containing protein [bacterium]MBU1635078.1 CBS domain-containing protein [bacterium]MBU1874487.1 CBS domain-containing protein [bacterium]